VPKTLLKNSTTDEWRPKPEGALSSYLAHELKIRIGGRGAVVNREVLILPTNAYDAGERTDVHVQANLTQYDLGANASNAPPVVTVVIEVKGNWHDDVFGAQETQLAKDYLPKVDSDAGAFVVGWFDPELWGDFDARRRTDAGRDGRQRSELEASLREQASEIRKNLGVTTTPIVINIPRPSTQTRTA
jgi:hypothetical protein